MIILYILNIKLCAMFGNLVILLFMKNFIYPSAFILVLSLLSSCEKSEPDPIEVISVEQEFEVFPSQSIESESTVLYLTVQATEADSCLNTMLDAYMEISGFDIQVHINGIVYPEFCNPGEIVASESFSLPNEEGVYSIEFMRDQLVSTSGTLVIDADAIELDIENLGGVFVLENKLNIVDENIVWGFMHEKEGLGPNDMVYLEEAMSEFEAVIPEFPKPAEGQYSYFEIDSNADVYIPAAKEGSVNNAYVIPDDMGWQYIIRSLERIDEVKPNVLIRFYRGNGESFEN